MSDNGKPEAANPFARTLPVAVSTHMLGVSKQVRKARKDADTPPGSASGEFFLVEGEGEEVEHRVDMVTVNKKILQCPEYEAVAAVTRSLGTYLRGVQVPGGRLLFRSGTYPIPLALVDRVEVVIKDHVRLFYDKVKDFLRAYNRRVEESMRRLSSQKVLGHDYDLADAADYPPLAEVKKAFWIDYQWVSFGAPTSLAGINKELYDREVKKVQEKCALAAEEVQAALRLIFKELVDQMVEQLKPGKEGRRKTLKEGFVSNMKGFLETFKERNITDDTQLERLAERARLLLANPMTDLDTLRESDSTRRVVAAKLSEIQKGVAAIVTDAPGRKIDLPD